MRDYQPSNLIAPQGIIFMIVAALVGGVAIGIITYFVSTLIYLIVIFPLLIGAAAGGLIAGAVIIGKVRSPMGAAIFGILIAVVLYGTYRFAEYEIGFKNDVRDTYLDSLREEATRSGVSISDAELEETLDSFLGDDTAADYELRESTGSTGFGAFIKLSADSGVTFNSSRSTSNSGFTISGTGAYIYWLIELVVIGGIAAMIASSRAKAPFCEETNEWYGKDEYVATLPSNGARQFYDYLKQGNFTAAGQMMTGSGGTASNVMVVVKKVNSPTADMVLIVKQVTVDNRGRKNSDDLHRGLLTPSEFSQLQASTQSTGNPAF